MIKECWINPHPKHPEDWFSTHPLPGWVRFVQAVPPEPIGSIHKAHFEKNDPTPWCKEVLLYSPGNLEALPDSRVMVYAGLWNSPEISAAVAAAERERIAQHFDGLDKGVGGFYDPEEPAAIIRSLDPL